MRSGPTEVRSSGRARPVANHATLAGFIALLMLLLLGGFAFAGGTEAFGLLCADRAEVERIYHEHRLGVKVPFDEAYPPAQIERAVQLDLKKEALLARVYQTPVTGRDVDAEVQRINSTTRAPQVLAEIKGALGHDPTRFAQTMARPLVVDRNLREQFDRDGKLHAPQRTVAERARQKVLAAVQPAQRVAVLQQEQSLAVSEVVWQLSARPASATRAQAAPPLPPNAATQSADYAVEATTQVAQPVNTQEADATKFSFEDLEPELQEVLRAELQQAGDVSSVIETPTAFLLFTAKERTADTLRVVSLTVPKQSYDEWLARHLE